MQEAPPANATGGVPEPLQVFIDSESVVAITIALGLGLLIGLPRERTADRLGGIRTYPLIAFFGVLAGQDGKVPNINRPPFTEPTGC